MLSPIFAQMLAGAMRGRRISKDRQYEQEQAETARTDRLNAQNAESAWRAKVYGDTLAQQQRQNQRQQEQDELNLSERGYVAQPRAAAEAAGVDAAGRAMQATGLDDAGIGTALRGASASVGASPLVQSYGQAMVKARESLAEKAARVARQERVADRDADRAGRVEDRDFGAQQRQAEREAQQRFDAAERAKDRASAAAIAGMRTTGTGTAKLKQSPMGAIDDYTGLRAIAGELTQLGELLETKDGAGAFGMKTLLPDMALNRMDPKGTLARQLVSNFSSLTFLDRSGAAVSEGEARRLKPYLLTGQETPDVMKTKIGHILDFLEEKRLQMEASYNQETGYMPLSTNVGKSLRPAAGGTAPTAPVAPLPNPLQGFGSGARPKSIDDLVVRR